jgi:hypothetical protein
VRQIQEEKRRRKQKQKATGTGEDEIRRRSGLVVRRSTPPSSHHHLLYVYIARGKFGLKGRSMQIWDTRERSEIFCFRERKGFFPKSVCCYDVIYIFIVISLNL